jgi:hypothetical protein
VDGRDRDQRDMGFRSGMIALNPTDPPRFLPENSELQSHVCVALGLRRWSAAPWPAAGAIVCNSVDLLRLHDSLPGGFLLAMALWRLECNSLTQYLLSLPVRSFSYFNSDFSYLILVALTLVPEYQGGWAARETRPRVAPAGSSYKTPSSNPIANLTFPWHPIR